MMNIPGLEKHKILYEALTDFNDILKNRDSLTDMRIRDLGMRLRYAMEYIAQQYARERGMLWTTPFEIFNALQDAEVINETEASALHKARKISNRLAAHINDLPKPIELIEDAKRDLISILPKFMEDIPEPSTLPLLKDADAVKAVEAASVEQRKQWPLVKLNTGSIPLLQVDESCKDYDRAMAFERFSQSRKKTLLTGDSEIPPYNLNLVEWLYWNPNKEHRYVYTIPQGTFVRRGLLASDYLDRVNELIHQFNQNGEIGKPVYIPGLVQEYFGFSQVYFEGEELKYAPVEPAVILRDYALFCETVELPDCVTHIVYNDLLKQVNEFTLSSQVKGSVFSRVKHLILPKGKWGDRVFLRYFTNLETVNIKELGEIDPTPATGAPEVFPAVIQAPRDQRTRNSLVERLRYDPKFVAYINDVIFVREELRVQKWGVDTVYVPKWVFDAQKRFGVDTELVYQAACLVKGVDSKPVRVGPASSMGGFRSFSNEAEKQALVASLMADPDFMDFVEANQITRKEIWVREGKTIAEPHLMWPGKGADYMNAHADAVYEAGCRLKGLDPAPIVVEKPPVTYKKATPAIKKATTTGQKAAPADSKAAPPADKKSVGKIASLLGKLFDEK